MSIERSPQQLEQAFARIQRERMAPLGLCHPALQVSAVGFERRGGPMADEIGWLGVLLTPWCMNLVWWPDDSSGLADLGQTRRHRLGAQDYLFIGAHEPELGGYECCSLFGSMEAFRDQAEARAVAAAIADALHGAPATSPPLSPTRRGLMLGQFARRSEA